MKLENSTWRKQQMKETNNEQQSLVRTKQIAVRTKLRAGFEIFVGGERANGELKIFTGGRRKPAPANNMPSGTNI